MVPRHEKENLSPYLCGAGVNISSGEGLRNERRSFTHGEKKRVLEFMEQRLKMGKVSGLTRISPRVLRQ